MQHGALAAGWDMREGIAANTLYDQLKGFFRDCAGVLKAREAVDPDRFIVNQWDLDALAIVTAFKVMRGRWKKPEATAEDFASILETRGLPSTAMRLRDAAKPHLALTQHRRRKLPTRMTPVSSISIEWNHREPPPRQRPGAIRGHAHGDQVGRNLLPRAYEPSLRHPWQRGDRHRQSQLDAAQVEHRIGGHHRGDQHDSAQPAVPHE